MIELCAWEAALEVLGVRLARGSLPSSLSSAKGGDNVRTIIKLLEAVTNLIRAISELIREFKR